MEVLTKLSSDIREIMLQGNLFYSSIGSTNVALKRKKIKDSLEPKLGEYQPDMTQNAELPNEIEGAPQISAEMAVVALLSTHREKLQETYEKCTIYI
mmetsp:Transcript_11325/g.22542  ORF Transcript_11325/g.22542 Transcript_11325/m.22542 type:complete len:97 (+) Transcript_11325:56-346(+)